MSHYDNDVNPKTTDLIDQIPHELREFNGVEMQATDSVSDLAGKRHKDIIQDTLGMLKKAKIVGQRFRPTANFPQYSKLFHIEFRPNGQIRRIWLCRNLVLTLIAGYRVDIRYKIIQRWDDLESGRAIPAGGVSREVLDALAAIPKLIDERIQRQTERFEKIEHQMKNISQMAVPQQEEFMSAANIIRRFRRRALLSWPRFNSGGWFDQAYAKHYLATTGVKPNMAPKQHGKVRHEYIYPLQPERIGLICDFFDEYSHAKHPRQLSLVPKMTEEEKVEDEETPKGESEKSKRETDDGN